MKNSKKDQVKIIDEVRDFFDNEDGFHTNTLDEYTIIKLIIHALDSCIETQGLVEASYTVNNNYLLYEIDNYRFSIEVKDRNKFN